MFARIYTYICIDIYIYTLFNIGVVNYTGWGYTVESSGLGIASLPADSISPQKHPEKPPFYFPEVGTKELWAKLRWDLGLGV